ncbi:GntR family transcriptional regulator [Orrella daihaiensis]|uniref:GntR family transcriptional regulator n=1 Tax=Orrella daihaiensis TaxID=2782176 RepID=A0ABY4AMK5_9BURK|nr:GntR family transcriptional regulator [Orrella daihaiensis]
MSDRIRADLAEQISQGLLTPGDTIDENQIASRYDVSKTPVREALLQLKAQGLVSNLPRGGAIVAKMDLAQLLSLWEWLAEIEAIAVKLACERMSAKELEALQQIHKQSQKFADKEDWDGWQAGNQQFHQALYTASRNVFLRQEVMRVRARTGVYRRHAFGALGATQTSYEQHGEILGFLTARDGESAAMAMRRHILPASNTTALTNFILNIPKDLLAK